MQNTYSHKGSGGHIYNYTVRFKAQLRTVTSNQKNLQSLSHNL
jgi:hypothetical protein